MSTGREGHRRKPQEQEPDLRPSADPRPACLRAPRRRDRAIRPKTGRRCCRPAPARNANRRKEKERPPAGEAPRGRPHACQRPAPSHCRPRLPAPRPITGEQEEAGGLRDRSNAYFGPVGSQDLGRAGLVRPANPRLGGGYIRHSRDLGSAPRVDVYLPTYKRLSHGEGEGGGEWAEAERGRRRWLRRKREEGQGSSGGREARDSNEDNRREQWSSSRPSGLSGSFSTQVSQGRRKGGRVFYVGGQGETLHPSPLPHIRGFGRQAPPPCTFQGSRRRRPL